MSCHRSHRVRSRRRDASRFAPASTAKAIPSGHRAPSLLSVAVQDKTQNRFFPLPSKASYRSIQSSMGHRPLGQPPRPRTANHRNYHPTTTGPKNQPQQVGFLAFLPIGLFLTHGFSCRARKVKTGRFDEGVSARNDLAAPVASRWYRWRPSSSNPLMRRRAYRKRERHQERE